jgi:uncharacterized protein (DUF885 family)
MFRLILIAVLSLLAVAFASPSTSAWAATPAENLHNLLNEAWEFRLSEDPLAATYYGDPRFNDRLPEVTKERHQKQRTTWAEFLKRLKEIDRASLPREDQINYDIVERLLRDWIAELDFQTYLTPITNRNGFHIDFAELPEMMPLETVKDYQNYLARLRGFSRYAQQHIDLMREGIRLQHVLPDVVLRDYEAPIKTNLVEDPTQSMLYGPFKELPESISKQQAEELRAAAQQAISESVLPGYQAFLEFMRDEYVPAARTQIGAAALPQGRDFYRHRVRRYTTLEMTPQQVHDIGISEVKRIRAEMESAIKRSGFEGDFAPFVEFLRTDPQFYTDTPEQLLAEVSLVLKRMDGQLPRLFGKLPRMPYGIREIPAFIAPQTTTAYYMGPAADGTRAGFYYVNTHNLKSRPLFEIEALSLHEAVPGHHLQIALQMELEGIPRLRRFAGFTAFIEGWGLYAESLGLEVGFYEDPYRDFGRLSYEMWRACRLVVDTGMHYLGWTRAQAINFMAENTALTLHNITTEVDRYIAWPGQAVAYKIGELTIRRLRNESEAALGATFDVRSFHDVVLGSGAVPLSVLEDNVRAWLASQKAESAESAESN